MEKIDNKQTRLNEIFLKNHHAHMISTNLMLMEARKLYVHIITILNLFEKTSFCNNM